MLLTAILAKILPVTFLENGILMYGTAMPQRLKYLKSMWQMKLKRGEFRFRRDRNALMVRLQDKNEIFFVSTRYSAKTCNGDEGSERKLVLNKDYNKYVFLAGKIGLGNQDCSPYDGRSYLECFHFVEQIWKNYASFKIKIGIH